MNATVINSLLGMETMKRSFSKMWFVLWPTYVPCLPVKPWYITLVSLFIRRLLAVAAYGDEAVAYALLLEYFRTAFALLRNDCMVNTVVL